jgi:hypothetical protein
VGYPVRDAAPEQIRTERLRRIGPKHIPVSHPQLDDWHRCQPIQLGLDGWIGWFSWRGLPHDHHRIVLGLAIR